MLARQPSLSLKYMIISSHQCYVNVKGHYLSLLNFFNVHVHVHVIILLYGYFGCMCLCRFEEDKDNPGSMTVFLKTD